MSPLRQMKTRTSFYFTKTKIYRQDIYFASFPFSQPLKTFCKGCAALHLNLNVS